MCAAAFMDRAAHAPRTPARTRQAEASAAALAAREARGLVNVPTTEPRGEPPHRANLGPNASRAALLSEVGAFEVDADGRRLAKLRMNVSFASRAHGVSRKGHRTDVPWMVTTTYAAPDNSAWSPDHIKNALNACRKWAQRLGFDFRYVWVAELQKRGVIHYHVMCWLPKGIAMPKWDKRGWWPHGMSNRIRARNATGYLMKYLSKGTDYGRLPRGARAYGIGGLEHSLRRARRWLGLPSFVQGNSSTLDDWRRAEGGGWRRPDGVVLASEFASVVVSGRRALVRVCKHARSIDAAGPFSWLSDRATALQLHH